MGASDRLTARQKDCLRLVGRGYTSKEIGPLLGISYATVNNYVSAAVETLGAKSRGEAARLFLDLDLDERLIDEPPGLACTPPSPPPSMATEKDGIGPQSFVPPLGGRRNTLGSEGKIYAIIKVAVLGLSTLIAITIAIATGFWLLR